jgi:flagellar motility protein MotE (MotC chaperone)
MMRKLLPIRLFGFRLRALPLFCAVAGLALLAKVGSLAVDAGDISLASARAAQPEAPKAPAPAAADPAARPAPPPPADPETLKALAEKRAELEKRRAEMREREAVLEATEKRVQEKIAKLREAEKSIETAAKQRDAEETARLKSLVKIYEKMKPKDAARVLERLEIDVLLAVVEGMKESKVAPILAAMDPARAKSVTVALATKHESGGETEDEAAQ